MRKFFDGLQGKFTTLQTSRFGGSAFRTTCGFMALAASGIVATGQTPLPPATPTPTQDPTQQTHPAAPTSPEVTPAVPTAQEPAPQKTPAATPEKDPVLHAGAFSIQTTAGEIKEDQLRQMLAGKTLYLRGGYQDNNLEFDEQGRLLSKSAKGSYTLSQIQINKVKLSKKKVELCGDRYALHFLGAAPYEDPTSATDRVKINPKKKVVRISFERQEVEKPKDKDKDSKKKDKHSAKSGNTKKLAAAPATPTIAANTAASPSSATTPPQASSRAFDKKKAVTQSEAQASQTLLTAVNNVFSLGVDERMIDAMPDFWKLYYQAAQSKADYKPTDPGVYHQNAVDQKAKLISALDPPSNELAQANGIAGIALYHAVIGSDGKVEEVVAGRPIGFGLDEGAEQTIRKANFQPALKDGKPVPVALDLVVSFRIFSKLTSQPAQVATNAVEKPKEIVLPGPYTAQAQAQALAQAQSQPQPQGEPQQAPQPSPAPQ